MTSRPPAADSRSVVLDETDPHAGDDLAWADPAPAEESRPLLFWKGLVLGLALSAVAWVLLTAVGFTIYALLGSR